MFKIISLVILLSISLFSSAQPVADKPKILYGACTKQDLSAAPFDAWFNKNYEAYTPDVATVAALKKENWKDISIKVFFGTWCGDSKREVPRFLKLLDDASFPSAKISIIAVGSNDSLYKQSPQHEETSLGIYKVPAFIIYRAGKEINRIVEFPSLSLEKDLLAIVQNKPYTPNYSSFSWISKWIADGTLMDPNASMHGLSAQLRPLVNTENELNSVGYVLLAQKKTKEALNVFLINYYLFPQSSNIASSLGEGYLENGDKKNAVYYLEYALSLNKDPKAVRGILDLLYKCQ